MREKEDKIQTIHIAELLKDFDNEINEKGEHRLHSLSFITLNGNLHRFEKCYKIGLPVQVRKEKRLRNLRSAITGEEFIFDFRLLIEYEGKKVRY